MGSFFTNVQVRARDVGAVLEAVRGVAAKAGLDEVAGGDADRTVLVGAEGDWISIYDEESEGQDQRVLDRLATAVTKKTGAGAVTVLVHDSDVLELGLFRGGKRVDRYNSAPAYFGEVSAAAKKEAAGRAELWEPVLAAGVGAGDLRAAFASEELFAERTLTTIAKLLGIDPARACVGYRGAARSGADFVTLRFRSKKRPAHETPNEGATRFEMGGHSPEVDVSAGFPVQLGCAVRNAGGGSRGVSVVVSGDAIDRGLVAIDEVELVVGSPRDGNRVRARLEGGRASFPDVEIPAGRTLDLAALAGRPEKMVDLMYGSQIHANLFARGGAVGDGELRVAFVPASAPGGQYVHAMLVHAQRAPHRPLRAPADVQAHLLRPLEGRRTLFALASMDLDHAEAAAIAERFVERWSRFFDGAMNWSAFRSDPGKRPLSGTASWKKIVPHLRAERFVGAEGGGSGFAVGGSLMPPEVPGDPELPTLALFTRGDRDATLANEIMDAIMTEHRGVQAMVGRWDWTPAYSLDSTPYEIACGIHGQCTLRKSWLERFVRGVAPGTLWLPGERIEIEEADLDAVEARLAPRLPTTEDWRRGVDELYGR